MRLRTLCALGCVGLLIAASVRAQDEDAGAAERDPTHAQWPWYAEIMQPPTTGAWYAFATPADVFGKATPDLRDLRLADAKGTRVPYVLRILHGKAEITPVPILRQFDAGPSEKNRWYQVSLALGDPGNGHNEIEIETPGTNYRRRVQVFADKTDRFEDPKPLLPKDKYLVHFDVDAGVVRIKRFNYSLQQARFLQVRVEADPVADKEIPPITAVHVRRKIVTPGVETSHRGALQGRQDVRTDQGPGSAWFIDFQEPLPCGKLRFSAAGDIVERPHQVQIANPKEPRQFVPVSEWRVQEAQGQQTLEIVLSREVVAQRLRFVVTDFANPPLDLHSVEAVAAVRQVIFEAPPNRFAWPLRLYFGNTEAGPARYDLEKKLPPVLEPAPVAVTVGPRIANPAYQPPTPPLHERQPWLIYTVLGVASAVLLGLLMLLARQAMKRQAVKAS